VVVHCDQSMIQGRDEAVFNRFATCLANLFSISTESLAFHLLLRLETREGNMSSVLTKVELSFSIAAW
jgi:hypothetical protein